jgi:citronellol/citronellal dehydrogenase
MSKLKHRTILITGASRGIGREMALRCAADGANLVIAAKSTEPNPKLPGTIHSVADEVEQAGGHALPLVLDVRNDEQIDAVLAQAARHFGGIDAVINNAGAIKLANSETLPMKRFDLMHQINTRAVLAVTKAALPWLKKSGHGHVINLSPPISLDPRWFESFGPYTLTKYGMSMLTLGMAAEYRRYNIAVNSLWPQTLIATAAIEFEAGGQQAMARGRHPRIMADAAYQILVTEHCALTGQCLIDETLLRERGVTDFECYRFDPNHDKPLMTDLFL